MDLFKEAKKVTDAQCHPKFLILRDKLPLERMIVDNWAKGMQDRDGKFVREFQETFHSAFWEVLIYRILINAGYELDQSHPMPDFCVKEPHVFIEAVTANITGEKAQQIKTEIKKFEESHRDPTKKESVSSLKTLAYGNLRSPIDFFDSLLPPYLNDNFDKNLIYSIIRYSNAISSKFKKYNEEYSKKPWVDNSDPFVIAMASFDELKYGTEYIYAMIALLYGKIYDPESNTYIPKERIWKTDKDTIDIGLFNKPEYEQISAIMFTCTLTLGKLTANVISKGQPSLNKVFTIHEDMSTPNVLHEKIYPRFLIKEVSDTQKEEITEGVFIFHNPNAKNVLPDSFLASTCVTNIYFENGQMTFSGNGLPIVARCNIIAPIYDGLLPSIYELLRLYNRMTSEEFYPTE